jgi:hypothetical protein
LFQAMDAAGCMAVLEGAVGAGAVICRSWSRATMDWAVE